MSLPFFFLAIKMHNGILHVFASLLPLYLLPLIDLKQSKKHKMFREVESGRRRH